MKRVVSGIQASGDLTIGNYLGAIKPWVNSQTEQENFFFIPDLHTLTVPQEPKALSSNTLSTVAWFIAAGIDPRKSVIFVQSQVPAHTELSWILSSFTMMGELSRMTQYKDKSRRYGAAGQNVGLYTYPVLMAADILLYDADEVPVGKDQAQHVELTRDIAERFNNRYGNVFKLPAVKLDEAGALIMDLQEPTKKMSKSDSLESIGVVRLFDTPDVIHRKVTRATTDSGKEVKSDPKKPGITNLLNIMAALTDRTVKSIESDFRDKTYAEFKAKVAEMIVQKLEPLQKRQKQLLADEARLLAVLGGGRKKALGIADKKLAQVKQKLGLL